MSRTSQIVMLAIEQRIEQLMDADPNLTEAEAHSLVMREDPTKLLTEITITHKPRRQ